MLRDSLYIIRSGNNESNIVVTDVELNAAHEIFKGHFPNQPVLPGVCILQMARELLEVALDKKLFLSKAGDIRFIEMIDPTKNNIIQFQIQYKNVDEASLTINAKVLKEDVVCCKIKATLKVQ